MLANRHSEFLDAGGRIFGISADSPAQNAAVIEKLALSFPILSDEDREAAITPLGFADEKDPRQISRPGVVIVDPEGEIVWRHTGRDFADRPTEDTILDALSGLGLPSTTQDPPEVGPAQAGDSAAGLETLEHYFKGGRSATLALRGRYRDVGEEFRDDTKAYIAMVERYMEALATRGQRKA